MFTYFFSLAIIAFEVICCKIFFESFCDSSGENRKYKRTILLVLLIAIYYICGFTLSKWIVLKQLCAIMSTAIIMRFYFEISKVCGVCNIISRIIDVSGLFSLCRE